jgi:hypothetical protein
MPIPVLRWGCTTRLFAQPTGDIFCTTDGGASWLSQESGTNQTFGAVSFAGANAVTAVGYNGTILRAEDVATGIRERPAAAPRLLSQNHPNPFNPVTSIRYVVPDASHVTLRVYSLSGLLVRTLVDRALPAGTREVTWNGTDNAGNSVVSGVYFYQLRAGTFTESRKMVLLK